MRRTRAIIITVGAVLAMAGTAYALTVNPMGGPPGSHYQVEVPCSSEPNVKVRDLIAGMPQATLMPRTGVESSPGTWTFDIEAGDVDQLVLSSCGDEGEQFRYNVDNPQLFPGPTYDQFGGYRPELGYTSVVGTDCPAGTTATVTMTGPGGFTNTQTADIDTYGNWEVPFPASTPHGNITVNASCGSLRFAPLLMPFGGGPWPDQSDLTSSSTSVEGGSSNSTAASSSTSTTTGATAASPIVADPRYTG